MSVTIDDIIYYLDIPGSNEATVIGTTLTSGSLTIPSSVTYDMTTYTVVAIADDAFNGISGLTNSLTIPSSVRSIGIASFSGCSGFTGSLIIPNSVTLIEGYAFQGCSGFTGSLIIPNSITFISSFVFYNCSGFTGSLIIPNTVTYVDTSAFQGCSGFTGSLTIPNSVSLINNSAFSGCTGITSVFVENQQGCTVQSNSFSNVTSVPNSQITFYYTPSSAELTSNWATIASNFNDVNYSAACFNEGTKILCLNNHFEEEYIPIENLKKGDIVKSYKHGYRKIDMIGKNKMANDPNMFHNCMYKMEKTEENGLTEDLIVTGWHSILTDDLKEYKEENTRRLGSQQMIDDKYLLVASVSKDSKKIENNELYTYYHFILENNGDNEERFGVWANGILTETPSKNVFLTHFREL